MIKTPKITTSQTISGYNTTLEMLNKLDQVNNLIYEIESLNRTSLGVIPVDSDIESDTNEIKEKLDELYEYIKSKGKHMYYVIKINDIKQK
jgi:hypothetical protein